MATGFQQGLLAIELNNSGAVGVDATGGLAYAPTRAFDVVDLLVIPTATVAAARVNLSNGPDSPATRLTPRNLLCTTTGVIDRPTDFANTSFVPGNTLEINALAGATPELARFICNIFVVPPGVPITLV